MFLLVLLTLQAAALYADQWIRDKRKASEAAFLLELRRLVLAEFESQRPTPTRTIIPPSPSATSYDSDMTSWSWMPFFVFFLVLMGVAFLLTIGKHCMTVLDLQMIKRRFYDVFPDLRVGESFHEDCEAFFYRYSEGHAFMSKVRNRYSRATAGYLARIAHLEKEIDDNATNANDLVKSQADEIDRLRQKLAELEAHRGDIGHLQLAEAVEAHDTSEPTVSTVEEVVPQGITEPDLRQTEAQPAVDAQQAEASVAAVGEVEEQEEEEREDSKEEEKKIPRKKRTRGKRGGRKVKASKDTPAEESTSAAEGSSKAMDPPLAVETPMVVETPVAVDTPMAVTTPTVVVESPVIVASSAAVVAPTIASPAMASPAAPKASALAAWANFGATDAKREADKAALLAEKRRQEVKQDLQLPTFNETWKQVKVGISGGNRKVVGVDHPTYPSVNERPPVNMPSTLPNRSGSNSSVPAPSRSQFSGTGQTVAPRGQRGQPVVNLPPVKPKPTTTEEDKGKGMAHSTWAPKA